MERQQPPGRRRLDQIRESMDQNSLQALVCRLPENILLVTGYWPQTGLSIAVIPLEGDPIVILPREELDLAETSWVEDLRPFDCWQVGLASPHESLGTLLRQAAQDLSLQGRAIGYEGSFELVAPSQMAGEPACFSLPSYSTLAGVFGASELVDATRMLYDLRAVKTPEELDRMTIAHEVAAFGLAAFKQGAVAGRTEAEVAAEVEHAIYARGVGYRGARYARGWAQITSGPRTERAWWYPVSSSRRLQEGELVVLEFGVMVDGFWSDTTRTVTVGRAGDRQRELYRMLQMAQRAALAEVKPGALAEAVDAAARRSIEKYGLGSRFVHGTGHGIGFRIHEASPILAPGSEDVLAGGMVFTIEPGVYIPGFGGLRKEDEARVTGDGGYMLSCIEYELD